MGAKVLFPFALALLLAGCPKRDAPVASGGGSDAAPVEASADAGTADEGDAGEAGAHSELALALPWTEAIRADKWKEAEESHRCAPRRRAEQARGALRTRARRPRARQACRCRRAARQARERSAAPPRGDREGPRAGRARRRSVRPRRRVVRDAFTALGVARGRRGVGEGGRARARTHAVRSRARRRQEAARPRGEDARRCACASRARRTATRPPPSTHDGSRRTRSTTRPRPPAPSCSRSRSPLPRSPPTSSSRARASSPRQVAPTRRSAPSSAPRARPGKPASLVDLCHARAEAYYKARTRYPEAALAYRACAALGGPRAAEDAFLSARAFSRADRDGDALPAFAVRHPATPQDDLGRPGRVPRRTRACARGSMEGGCPRARRVREALPERSRQARGRALSRRLAPHGPRRQGRAQAPRGSRGRRRRLVLAGALAEPRRPGGATRRRSHACGRALVGRRTREAAQLARARRSRPPHRRERAARR